MSVESLKGGVRDTTPALVRDEFALGLVVALTVAPLSALMLWIAVVTGANADQISGLGLITAIPPHAFLCLGLLVISFGVAVCQRRLSPPLLLLHVVVLIVILYGTAYLIEGFPRTGVAWRLTGIMDRVMTTGTVDPGRDAFQNWPGFFILIAFLTSVAGLDSPLVLAAWAHVIFNLLYLGPLLLLFRTATADQRLVWLGVWFFYLCNWIGQDYLAPQAFGFFYYLLTLAMLLAWFRAGPDWWTAVRPRLSFLPSRAVTGLDAWFAGLPESSHRAPSTRQRAGLLALVVAFAIVITPSHQLTPVALMTVTAVLVVFGRITPRTLPLLLGVMIVAWISFMAVPFVSGHVEVFTEPLGAVGDNVNENLTRRVRGSEPHRIVVLVRMFTSLCIWALAGMGVLRRLRNGTRDTSFAMLAAVPFGLLALQTYGGELLLRTFLFSLPFVAFFVAALFIPRPVFRRAWVALPIITVSAALGGAMFVTRYGNERMDYFTPEEVEAVRYLYAIAPPGSLVLAGTDMLPWRFIEYDTHTYYTVEGHIRERAVEDLAWIMSDRRYTRSFLILTRSQRAAFEDFLGWDPRVWDDFEVLLRSSPDFELVFSNSDSAIFVRTRPHDQAQ